MKKSSKKIYSIFIILSLTFGIIFSILIPLYQVPDEETHLNLLYSYLGNDIDFSESVNDFGDTERIITNYNEKVNLDNYLNFNEKLNILDKINKIDIHIIRYFPQTIGILISELFNLPVLISVTISEFFSVIFYTIICLITLKLMPVKKQTMMMIMLLPLCIQQMGSFSYDVVLISFSFLLISYIFYLKYDKKEINIKDLIKLFSILLIIALVKIPYVLLGLLVFILPKNKINLISKINKLYEKNKKIKLVITLIIVISIINIITFKYLLKISYIKALLAFIINPFDGIQLIIRTFKVNQLYYPMSIVGYFGWLDTPVSIWFLNFVVFCLLTVSILSKDTNKDNNTKNNLKIKERIYVLCLGIILSFIIVISLYSWTLLYLGIDNSNLSIIDYSKYFTYIRTVLGVQGRYFIPIIPLFLIPLDINIKIKKKKIILTLIQIIYYIILFIYMLLIILERYWIT